MYADEVSDLYVLLKYIVIQVVHAQKCYDPRKAFTATDVRYVCVCV